MTERCPTCGQRKKRSNPQNARLHSLFTLLQDNVKAADGQFHHLQWWKAMCKAQWLGFDEYRRPDGEAIQVLRSTSECDVAELNEFMSKVEAYCAQRGVWLDE